jgi:hypothetical protein
VLLYSDPTQIVLQLRRQVPTEEDLLAPSFKVGVSLTPLEATQLVEDLLGFALAHLHIREVATSSSANGQAEDEEMSDD